MTPEKLDLWDIASAYDKANTEQNGTGERTPVFFVLTGNKKKVYICSDHLTFESCASP